MTDQNRRLTILLVVALLLILIGGLLAWNTQTSGGTIQIRDVRFMGTNGTLMSGLLYIPPGVTAENKAPGVLAVHGYINSRETQDGFAIEFARRGYVVLALDQTGHGYSDPPAFANGFGGPDGLRYLRSLDLVDPDNIAMEGHSMGGWASAIAAAAYPEDYRSILLVGSSTGTFGAPEGTAEFPRNLGLIFSEWDEFSQLMWGAPVAKDIASTDKLKTLFNTTETVEVGKLYGSIEDGTARKLYMPRTTHPGDHISNEAIGNAIEWLQLTLKGGNGLDPNDQVWYWKEIGTFLGFIGMVLFMFPFGALLLKTPFFSELAEPMPEAKGIAGGGWWLAAALTAFIPAITFFWLQHRGNELFPNGSFWPQNITTGILVWAVGNALITLVLFLAWHYQINRKAGATINHYGFVWDSRLNWRKIGKSLLLALCIAAAAYVLLLLAAAIFTIDFRLWVLALKPMSPLHFQIFLAYLIPFAFFFLVSSMAINSQLRRVELGLGRTMVINGVILCLGIVILLLIQYIPLLSGNPLPLSEPLLTIVAFQFVPLLFIVGLVSTYFFHKTGRIYVGAFLNALFITAYIVAGQAIQFAF